MTLYQTFHEASLVFRALQNAWPDAVANQFPDRPGCLRRDSLGHAMGFPWPQADAGFLRIARNMRIFAAWKAVALSAGVAISSVGCGAGRTRWHHRPRRADRCRSFGSPWWSGHQWRRRSADCSGGPFESIPEHAHHLFRRKREVDLRRCEGSLLRDRVAREPRRFQSAIDYGAARAKHPGERRIFQGAGRAKKRRAMAAGDVGLPHAAVGRSVPEGWI